MSDKTKRPYFFRILCVLWMTVIFVFSSRNGEVSSNDSGQILLFFQDFFSVPGDKLSETVVYAATFVIRKSAHIFEYFVLGVLVSGSLYSNKPNKKSVSTAFVLCVLYRASDEIHQLFVPGRSGMVRDVFIDSIGIALGVFIYRVIISTISKRKNVIE